MCLTIRYTITSITFKHVVDKLTVYKQYFQNGKKNLSEKKKESQEKSWQEIWVGSTAHTLKSYTAKATKGSLPTFTKHVFQQSMVNSK